MAVISGVFGQQENGYIPGEGQSCIVDTNDGYILGSVGLGQRAEVVIVPRVVDETPAANIVVSCCVNKFSTGSSRRDGAPIAVNVPVEIFDPTGGGSVVFISKQIADADDFTAYLYPIDGSASTFSAPPLLSCDTGEEEVNTTASGISLDLPTGAAVHDLLFAWIGWTGADTTLDDTGRSPGISGWTELLNENGTAGISNGATPTVRCFYHLLETGETGPFRWGKTGTSYTWSGTVHSLRASGVDDLSGYGLNFVSYGFPSAQLEAGTTESSDWHGVSLQEAKFNTSDIVIQMGMPIMISACVVASGYVGDGTGLIAHNLRDGGTVTWPRYQYHAEDISSNGMMAVGYIVTGRPEIELSFALINEETPFNWFGGWVVLTNTDT